MDTKELEQVIINEILEARLDYTRYNPYAYIISSGRFLDSLFRRFGSRQKTHVAIQRCDWQRIREIVGCPERR